MAFKSTLCDITRPPKLQFSQLQWWETPSCKCERAFLLPASLQWTLWLLSSGYCPYHHCLVSEVTSWPKGRFWDLLSCPCSDQLFEPMFSLPPKKTFYCNRLNKKTLENTRGASTCQVGIWSPVKFNGPSVHVTDAELHHFADEAQGSHKPRRSLNYSENEDFEPKHEVLEDHFLVQLGDIYRFQPRSFFQGCFQCGVVKHVGVSSNISAILCFNAKRCGADNQKSYAHKVNKYIRYTVESLWDIMKPLGRLVTLVIPIPPNMEYHGVGPEH